MDIQNGSVAILAQVTQVPRSLPCVTFPSMPEVIISGKVYSIDPRDFVTEPRLSRSQAADGRIPKVRDQKLTGPVTTSVRECMSYHVHGVPHEDDYAQLYAGYQF